MRVRYFETTNSSAEISYRYFADDAGLNGHTYELSWLKRIGEKVVLNLLADFICKMPPTITSRLLMARP